ncbi:MAG: hypothetical protein J1E40_08380 [Oscillospiraceae bacterium]|nr:hypothetical protein [Oscillospiraceae bacterium]
MKINNNNIRQWYLDFFFGRNRVKPLLPKTSNNNNCDTFRLSSKAKRAALNAHIEKTLNSGEPMTGVSYEEFCDYYYDKHGFRKSNDEMMQEYRQALKGDNASLREKEWRTNPEYRMPTRLFNSPEVTADREAALEKIRNGEELEPWEKRLMTTFPDMSIGSKREEEAYNIRTINIVQKKISDAISSVGIELDEDTELNFEVWGRSITVSGNLDNETLETIQKALSECSNGNLGYGLQNIYYKEHDGYSKQCGVEVGFLMKAEELLQDLGEGITIFDLSIDKDGNIVGLPESMDKFIKENAIGKFGDTLDLKYVYKEKDILEARYIKEAFLTAVNAVQDGSDERMKSMTCKLTYKNGVLSC